MNTVAMIHKGGLTMAETLGPVWRRAAEEGKLVVVENPDCPGRYPWADEVETWACDPGHNGIDQCRRHLRCVEIAAGLPGTTAIVEPDAFAAAAVEVPPGELWASKIWDAMELGDKRYVARFFPHPPYVAEQATWAAIAETLGWWLGNNFIFDDGHNDRVLGLASQIAGVRLVGRGYSNNTVKPWEAGNVRAAIEAGEPLIHGVKDPALIGWWLVREGFMKANLWAEMGVAPDIREIPWAMDLRHVEILRRIALAAAPERIMEIGSHRGHSTAGLLKALEDLPATELHLVEPAPTPELLQLIERSPVKTRVVLHRESSWETGLPCGLVFIDGNHEWPALADLAFALTQQTPVIVIHDTQSHHHKIGGCWGAQLAADILRGAAGRVWLEDCGHRPGEWTHRGLGVSVEVGLPSAGMIREIMDAAADE